MPNSDPLCNVCPFRALTLYSPLSNDEIARLRSPTPVRRVPARGVIQREGEVPNELYSLREGWAFRFKLLPDGRRQILRILMPGDFVTLQGLYQQPLWFSIKTITPVTLCAFDTKALADSIPNYEILYRRVEQFYATESMALDQRIIDLGRRSAVERMARLLLEIHKRFERRDEIDENGYFPFPLKQTHLADTLGLTPVHVSRVLTDLRNTGAITLESQKLRVDNRSRLTDIAAVQERELDLHVHSPLEAPPAVF